MKCPPLPLSLETVFFQQEFDGVGVGLGIPSCFIHFQLDFQVSLWAHAHGCVYLVTCCCGCGNVAVFVVLCLESGGTFLGEGTGKEPSRHQQQEQKMDEEVQEEGGRILHGCGWLV